MSNLITEQFPASVPEVPEKTQDKDLETIVSSLDKELHELKKFLKNKNRGSEFKKEPSSAACMAPVRDKASDHTDASPSVESHPPQNKRVPFAVTPLEAQAIAERLMYFSQEANIMERLMRAERQHRRLTILGSIFGTVMVMFMVVFAFLAMQANTPNRISLMQFSRGLISAKPVDKNLPPRETATKPPEAEAPLAQKTPSPTEVPVAAAQAPQPAENPSVAQETTTSPAPKESATLAGTPKEAALPAIKYVGSITSNKYHYPDCKWAKTIIPRKVRGFTSVAEAQKAGYIPCPACEPPPTEEIDSQVTLKE